MLNEIAHDSIPEAGMAIMYYSSNDAVCKYTKTMPCIFFKTNLRNIQNNFYNLSYTYIKQLFSKYNCMG